MSQVWRSYTGKCPLCKKDQIITVVSLESTFKSNIHLKTIHTYIPGNQRKGFSYKNFKLNMDWGGQLEFHFINHSEIIHFSRQEMRHYITWFHWIHICVTCCVTKERIASFSAAASADWSLPAHTFAHRHTHKSRLQLLPVITVAVSGSESATDHSNTHPVVTVTRVHRYAHTLAGLDRLLALG